MNCNDFRNSILFFIDEDLNEKNSVEFKKHLEICSDCKLLFEKIASTYALTEIDKITDSNPFFYTRVKAGIENQKSQANAVYSSKKWVLQWATYVVLGVFALFAGYLIANDQSFVSQESLQNQYEKADEELFADSYYFKLSKDDMYVLNTDETE
jgi:predicted anti-sigma-YlaC factor YlaD